MLAQVGVAEGITQQGLADSFLVPEGNVAQLLLRMEGCGLISRRREGRTSWLFLTDERRQLFAEVVPAHEALIEQRLSVLSPEEQKILHDLLRKLDRALDRGRVAGR